MNPKHCLDSHILAANRYSLVEDYFESKMSHYFDVLQVIDEYSVFSFYSGYSDTFSSLADQITAAEIQYVLEMQSDQNLSYPVFMWSIIANYIVRQLMIKQLYKSIT